MVLIVWTESSFSVDVIYSDLLFLFASIACSCTMMPDGTGLFADVQTELLSMCVCLREIKGGVLGICVLESLYKMIDVWTWVCGL